MVESSWSDPQSALTTELGVGDVADAPRRRCVVPKVRPGQRYGSDQLVPVYWDQTVPVWSCREASSRISTSKRKLMADSLCRYGASSRRFGGGPGGAGGATMFVDQALESCCCNDGREHSAAAASEVRVVVILISPAAPVLITSRCSRVATNHGCKACKHLWRGSPVALATTLGGAVAIRIAA